MNHSSSVPRIPFSPASPPEQGVKQTKKPDHITTSLTPTPPSPDSMSVAIKRWASLHSDGSHTNENMANTSSADYLSPSQRPVSDSASPQMPSQLQTQMQSQQRQSSMLKRPAPHDLDASGEDYDHASNKRLRKEDDADRDSQLDMSTNLVKHGKVEEDAHQSIDDILGANTGVGAPDKIMQTSSLVSRSPKVSMDSTLNGSEPLFRLGRSIHKRPKVDMSRPLLGDYGLHPLLSQVARHDPRTNEKINKLRKSYEGQIKIAKLPGKLGSYRQERDVDGGQPSKLRLLGVVPEDEFVAQHTERPIGDLSGLHDQVQKALRINPGIMPDRVAKVWDEVLGHTLSAGPVTQSSLMPPQAVRPQNGMRPSQMNANTTQERHTRKKKRSYQDESFAGYAGYGDGNSEPEIDHDVDTDYADRHGKRRRKD